MGAWYLENKPVKYFTEMIVDPFLNIRNQFIFISIFITIKFTRLDQICLKRKKKIDK